MKNNPEMASDCFNKKCRFHLRNGETVVGGVISDSNDRFIVEEVKGNKKEFAQELVRSYEVWDQGNWNFETHRSKLIGQSTASTIGSIKTKKMIIFGAGASFDFNGNNETISPLTNSLFNDNISIHNFPGALNLKPKILTAIDNGESLEDFFQEKWEEVYLKGDLDLLSKLINTQYYIQIYFKGVSVQLNNSYPNNYTRLLRHVQKYLKANQEENVAVVSFNYDTLFEDAMNHIYDCRYLKKEDYIFRDKYRFDNLKPIMLFKPHGSWNWVHKFKTKLTDNDAAFGAINSVSRLVYDQKLTLAELIFAIEPKLEGTDNLLHEIPSLFMENFNILDYDSKFDYGYYPNLLIPFSKKDNFLMPKSHESVMTLKMEDVEEILVIGWKGTESYFNETLKRKFQNKKVKIVYVSPYSKSVEIELKKYLPIAEFHRCQGTFTNYLEEMKKKGSEFNIFEV